MARRIRTGNDTDEAPTKTVRKPRKTETYTPPFVAKPLLPKTQRQDDLLKALRTSAQVITIGPPGTGKTFLPVGWAADSLLRGDIKQIVLARPVIPVSTGQKLGFRPGDVGEKMAEWMAELFKDLRDRMGVGAFDTALKNEHIIVVPFETMRGRTFNNAFVLLDEAQNCSYHELKMFLTRIGEGSQVCINGDLNQSDLKEESGLNVILRIARDAGLNVPLIEFGLDDIVRGDICAMWIRACYAYENARGDA